MDPRSMPQRAADVYQDASDRISDARLHAREYRETIALLGSRAPTLTTALLVLVLAIGGALGWFAAKPYMRSVVNAEWRAKIAKQSATVAAIIKAGDEESEAVDAEIIKAIGDTDAKLAQTLRFLARPRPADPAQPDRCTVPADCLRQH